MTSSDFEKNVMDQDAVMRNIEIIGEATQKITKKMKSTYIEIPWKEMAGMRDKLIHDYIGVEVYVVWKTIEIDIPELDRLLRGLDF